MTAKRMRFTFSRRPIRRLGCRHSQPPIDFHCSAPQWVECCSQKPDNPGNVGSERQNLGYKGPLRSLVRTEENTWRERRAIMESRVSVQGCSTMNGNKDQKDTYSRFHAPTSYISIKMVFAHAF
jgi:hypothetical protein